MYNVSSQIDAVVETQLLMKKVVGIILKLQLFWLFLTTLTMPGSSVSDNKYNVMLSLYFVSIIRIFKVSINQNC